MKKVLGIILSVTGTIVSVLSLILTIKGQMAVSYFFAGKETFDCAFLLHKLKTQFGIERLMVVGDGVTNWSFAAEGLVDELSIVIAPVADGGMESVSIFEKIGKQPHPPVSFTLKEVKSFDGDGV